MRRVKSVGLQLLCQLVCCCLLLSGGSSIANNIDLPDLHDSSGQIASPEFEKRLGQMFMRQIRQQTPLVEDLEIQSYMQAMGYRLTSNSGNPEREFTFLVINDSNINAFAGPSGIIGINSGIILNSSSESEVAAVVAHEIAHVTQRHLARTFESAKKYSLPTAAAMIGAILIGIHNPQAGATAMASISGINAQNRINFTRSNEEEADRVGIQILAAAGYDPRGMPSFFGKLQSASRYQKSAPEFLRTHPLTTSRIADTQARAEQYTDDVEYEDTLLYAFSRYKLLVDFHYKTPSEASVNLKKELDEGTKSDRENLALRYGLAYAYIANRDFRLAEQQVSYLLDEDSNNSAYILLKARMETERGDHGSALAAYKKAYELYPDYKPAIISYSRALLAGSEGRKARKVLRNYLRFYDHDEMTYSLLGQAEAMLGNHIETAILQAEYYYYIGDTKSAWEKLNSIEQQYKPNYYQKQRIKARLAEYRYELETMGAQRL